jgi:hypothetical protein
MYKVCVKVCKYKEQTITVNYMDFYHKCLNWFKERGVGASYKSGHHQPDWQSTCIYHVTLKYSKEI